MKLNLLCYIGKYWKSFIKWVLWPGCSVALQSGWLFQTGLRPNLHSQENVGLMGASIEMVHQWAPLLDGFGVWHVLTWQCVGNSDFRRLEGMWLERCNFRKSWTNRELRASSTISYNFANEGLYQLHVVNCLELCWPMMTPSSHTKPHVTVSSIETTVSFHLPFSSCRFCPLAKTGSMAGYCTW